MEADEAASRYFDATLARKLKLSGKVPYSIAHQVFLALVRRLPAPGWRCAELVRTRQPLSDRAQVLIPAASELALKQRVDKLDRAISDGNAARPLRERDGLLWIVAGHVQMELPEEMSLWDAIITIPPRLTTLQSGEEFNRFCSRVIDALRTANRPVQEVLGLGHNLCPFDWLDTLSTNQVRSLRRYLAGLPEGASLADWSQDTALQHWQRQPVAGFSNFEAFWASDIVCALREPRQRDYRGELDDLDIGDDIEDEREDVSLLDASEWQLLLTERVEQGQLSSIEAAMLERLYAGDSFDDLNNDPRFALILKASGSEEWAESIRLRLLS